MRPSRRGAARGAVSPRSARAARGPATSAQRSAPSDAARRWPMMSRPAVPSRSFRRPGVNPRELMPCSPARRHRRCVAPVAASRWGHGRSSHPSRLPMGAVPGRPRRRWLRTCLAARHRRWRQHARAHQPRPVPSHPPVPWPAPLLLVPLRPPSRPRARPLRVVQRPGVRVRSSCKARSGKADLRRCAHPRRPASGPSLLPPCLPRHPWHHRALQQPPALQQPRARQLPSQRRAPARPAWRQAPLPSQRLHGPPPRRPDRPHCRLVALHHPQSEAWSRVSSGLVMPHVMPFCHWLDGS